MTRSDPAPARALRRFGARRSTFWWMALVVVAVIVLVQGGMLMVYLHEQFIARVQSFTDAALDRAVSMRDLMDAAPQDMRPQLLVLLGDARQQLSLSDSPAAAATPPWRHMDRVREQIDFSRLPPEARLAIFEAPGRDRGRPGALVISLPLTDGWLNVTHRLGPQAAARNMRMVFWAVVATLLACAAALVAVRRATRPLRLLAAAAERLGDDLAAPPLEERGGREVRQAVRAFNGMQRRIRELVDDRTRMLAALSHDLRTQLTRLRLRLEMLPDPQHRAAAEADMQTMQAMVQGALAFARDDFGDESPREFDLAAMLATLCDGRHDLGEDVTFEGPGRLVLRGRPVALRRALDNLIGNAVRYGSLARVRLEERDDRVCVEIEDRGPGIPVADRDRALQPFARLEDSRNPDTGGAGLGLAVAAAAARAHSGQLVLDTAEGGGLLVRLELPRR